MERLRAGEGAPETAEKRRLRRQAELIAAERQASRQRPKDPMTRRPLRGPSPGQRRP